MKLFLRKVMSRTGQDERGQTAILSVVFFTLAMMILTISFMNIVTAEQAQTTNTELEASALAAAESGIDDAKRILMYCVGLINSNTDIQDMDGDEKITGKDKKLAAQASANTDISECARAIYNDEDSCDAVSDEVLGNVVGSALQTDVADGQVRVGTSGNEFYSCMIIKSELGYFIDTVSPGKSSIIPLTEDNLTYTNNGGNEVNSGVVSYVELDWHNLSEGVDGSTTLKGGTDFPSSSNWGDSPAVLRVELVAVPKGTFNLSDLSSTDNPGGVQTKRASDLAVTLRPSTAGNAANNTIGFAKFGASSTPNQTSHPLPLQAVACNTNGTTNSRSESTGYACTFEFNATDTDGKDTGNKFHSCGKLDICDYYLRVQSIYNTAQIRVSAYKNDQMYKFDGVEASIDITGRASNVFKRISAIVKPESSNAIDNWFPEYAIDSASPVCKQMSIGVDNGTDMCKYD